MTAGLIWAALVLNAMGWFAIGWVARGHENRKYAENRLRALAADAVLDTYVPVEAERLPAPVPAVVNVHLAMLQGSTHPWPVLNGSYAVPELPQR